MTTNKKSYSSKEDLQLKRIEMRLSELLPHRKQSLMAALLTESSDVQRAQMLKNLDTIAEMPKNERERTMRRLELQHAHQLRKAIPRNLWSKQDHHDEAAYTGFIVGEVLRNLVQSVKSFLNPFSKYK